MRVVVNDIAADGGGALTVLRSFAAHVRDEEQDHEWIFLVARQGLIQPSANIRIIPLDAVKRSWFHRLLFDAVSGRWWIRSLAPDAIFSLQNTYTYGLPDTPQVIYVHQPLPFQRVKNFSLWRREERRAAMYQHLVGRVIRRSIQKADHVIVQTRWMKRAILEQVPGAAGKVEHIAPDLENLEPYRRTGEMDRGLFVYPTGDQIYKNQACLLDACRLLNAQNLSDFRVVITSCVHTETPNVVSVGRLRHSDAVALMATATLVFPSLIESYGLPLAEARALGTLVLAADCSYAREVLEGYCNAYFFNPSDPGGLAALMRRVIEGDITLREHQDVQEDRGSAWGAVVRLIEECVGEEQPH